MTTTDGIDWNDMRAVQLEITRWASTNWPDRTYHQALSKLVLEEIPELLQHRKEHGMSGIGPELADCFILLMDLATMWSVDLPDAIRAKMGINYSRMWLRDPATGIVQHVQVKHPPAGQYHPGWEDPRKGPLISAEKPTLTTKAELSQHLMMGSAELAARLYDTPERPRNAAPYYVHWNGATALVKDGRFFREQGGLEKDWGRGWAGIRADNIEHARDICELMQATGLLGDY